MFEQTKALCQHYLKMGIPGFDMVVYKDGQCVFRYMDGYADLENKIPVQGKEKYHIYSCSKLVTCAAAMQLWEKGAFSLDDNLSDYLPAFGEITVKTKDGIQKAKNPIKIHHLFEMTAGLNYNWQTPALRDYYETGNPNCPTVEIVNQIAKGPLEFEPGTSWNYSLCHDVLGALIEIWSGQKFEIYVKEHIFAPLGMENSDFLHPMEDWEGVARLYGYDPKTNEFPLLLKNSNRPGKEYASGGGGCVSTVEDFIKFLEALRVGDVILKKETIAMMTTDRLTEQQRDAYIFGTPSIGYGLGMRVPRQDPRHTEFGWMGATGAYACVDPVNNMTLFYCQHVVMPPNRPLRHLVYNTVRADLLGEKYQLPFA